MNKFFHNKWFQKPLVISSFFISIPILYMYKSKLYSFFRSLLIKESKKKENILTQTDQYIEKNKQIFLENLDKADVLNSNVQKEFYNKDSYKKEVEDANNNLEEIWKKKNIDRTYPTRKYLYVL